MGTEKQCNETKPLKQKHKTKTYYGKTMLDKPITREEVRKNISQLRNNKACGDDNIPNELLKNGGPHLERALTALYKYCQKSRTSPHNGMTRNSQQYTKKETKWTWTTKEASASPVQ